MACPKCGSTNYKYAGQSHKPIKVLCHFPIIPQLKHMFRAHAMSNLMVWHVENKNSDGLVCHVVNSKVWAHIDARWLNFASEFHNLRLYRTCC
jgi:hypothetical protein